MRLLRISIFLVLASLAIVSCGGGGITSDRAFLEVKGRVQAISWAGGSGLTSGQWDLSRRGKITLGPWDKIKHDSRGHIKKASVWYSDYESGDEALIELEFRTSGPGRIKKAAVRSAGSEVIYQLERTRKGELASVQMQNGPATYVYSYGNYVYDQKGNWTERRFTVSCGETVTNSGIESRIIVYYE